MPSLNGVRCDLKHPQKWVGGLPLWFDSVLNVGLVEVGVEGHVLRKERGSQAVR